MKKRLHLILIILFSYFYTADILAQDFIFTEVPNPPNSQFNSFVAQTDDNTYLSYFDNAYNTFLYSYDGETLTDIGGPVDYTYSFFLTEQDENLFLAYNDYDYNTALVRYDGTDFTVLGTPNYDEFLNGYAFALDGTYYFAWFEFINFTQILRYIDGDNLIDVEIPVGFTFGNFVGELNGEAFVTLQDANFNQGLYSFDGNDFTEVTLPDNTTNPFLQIATADALYINLFDTGFNSLLYIFDGNDFDLVDLPMGFTLGNFIGEVDNQLFFNLNDNAYNGTLYRLDGTGWTGFPDTNYDLAFGDGVSNTAVYPSYTNDGFYTFSMGICDGTDLNIVENPLGFQYSQYQADWEDGVFASYFDATFNNSLQYYNGMDLQTVPPPNDLTYNFYEFELDELLHFTFRDFNFNRTLYYLGEPNEAPSAADNTVQTLVETPYMFTIEEFNFTDIDVDDTLSSIQIIAKPTLGILHSDGANIGTGDFILATEIENLTYVPFNDGMGMPYDSFSFKVFDGDDLSEETYIMFINVLEELVSTNDNLLATALEIFPNPTTDLITIKIDNYTPQQTAEILIYNQKGQAMERRMTTTLNETFVTDTWANGVYILVIREGENMVSRKIIVQ